MIRARLKELRERDWADDRRGTSTPTERVAAARRHAIEAHDSALRVLASSVEAFRHAAEAHEQAATTHAQAAAAGTGAVREHERQAAHHRLAAAADLRRAERAQSLLPKPERTEPAPVRRGRATA